MSADDLRPTQVAQGTVLHALRPPPLPPSAGTSAREQDGQPRMQMRPQRLAAPARNPHVPSALPLPTESAAKSEEESPLLTTNLLSVTLQPEIYRDTWPSSFQATVRDSHNDSPYNDVRHGPGRAFESPLQSPMATVSASRGAFPRGETADEPAPDPAAWLVPREDAKCPNEENVGATAFDPAACDPAAWLKGLPSGDSCETPVPEAECESVYTSTTESQAHAREVFGAAADKREEAERRRVQQEAALAQARERELFRALEYLEGVNSGKYAGDVFLEHCRKPPRAELDSAESHPSVSQASIASPRWVPIRGGPASGSEASAPPAGLFGFPMPAMSDAGVEEEGWDAVDDIDLDKPCPAMGVYGDSTRGHRVPGPRVI